MSQADQQVQNAAFPAVRTDINDNLAALYSQSSGASAPAVTVAFQPWIDTSSSPAVWKVRNASNTDWITIGTIDATTFSTGGITAIANGGTGETTAAAALAALLPSQAGNAGKALTTDGSLPSWGTAGSQLVQSTAVASTSGTSIDFTGIPSWAKRMTVMFSGVSTNGTSPIQIQLGKSGGVETTGYNCVCTVAVTAVATAAFSSGFGVQPAGYALAARSYHGHLVLSLMDGSTNTWTANGAFVDTASPYNFFTNGAKSLSGTLDRIRITTSTGTATFDAGSINIMYEG